MPQFGHDEYNELSASVANRTEIALLYGGSDDGGNDDNDADGDE